VASHMEMDDGTILETVHEPDDPAWEAHGAG
jgi:hypothetical protein